MDGVIISSSTEDDLLIHGLLDSDMPFVLIGLQLLDVPINYVDVDNVAGVRRAVTHLVRLGRRRIGHISGPMNTAVGRDRRQGYIEALVERGLSVREELIVESDFSETGGYMA